MTVPTPNYQASIDFLQQWCKGGPWVLVAIDPNKKGLEGDTFSGNNLEGLRAWLEEWGTKKRYNIYFTVNPCVRALKTKPSREHIASLSWLHVDLDPRAGEDLDAERKRIVALLSDPTAKGLPKPTALVFSGGGYQAFWRLREPHLLDGTPEAYEDAKRYNKQIELLLDGDNCHNVDRIMRLPGTINRPDPKKRKKGRVEVLAELIEFNSTQHDLAKFTKAPEVQGGSAPGFSAGTVKISGNLARISSVDDLPKAVSNQAKVCIVQGFDPDNTEKFGNSRSEWLFFVCCELVRGGCDDDLIYSVITDPDFGISASVLDKGSSTERYAIRQIERAREEAIDPMLREFNDRHALIGSINGKCRILCEEFDVGLGRDKVVYQTKSDFMLRYAKRTVDWMTNDGKPASKPAALWWLEHSMGAYYDSVTFAPGRDVKGAYNLWKGFAVEADPTGSCDIYLSHVKKNICGGNEEHYQYLLNWMARAVQRPGEPGQVAVVLRGDPGVGKGVFAQTFGKLWGRHFLPVTDSKHLVGSFNAHMRDCVVMYADEAFASDDDRATALLKTLVTEATIITEAKGVDAEPTPNYIHLIMASNSPWVLNVGAHDRRYFILDVKAEKRQDSTYFDALRRQMEEEGGLQALLAFLLARDISGFNVRAFPKTDVHGEQAEFSLTAEEEWWYAKLKEGEILPGQEWGEHVFVESLMFDFSNFMKNNRGGRVSTIALGRLLERFSAKLIIKRQLKFKAPVLVRQRDGTAHDMDRPQGYLLPPLQRCREVWAALGKPAKWPDPTEETEVSQVYPESGPDELDRKVLG
jgi:hypothetical protein